MDYSLINDWVEEFLDEHQLEEKDIVVEVFPQIIYKGIKIMQKQITVIYEKNLEAVAVYCENKFMYGLFYPNEVFKEDLKKHNVSMEESNY